MGTSATLGGRDDEDTIRRYASGVFHQPFEPGAVGGEVRQGIDEFLRDAIISSHLAPQADLPERTDPLRIKSVADYVAAQHETFFGTPPPAPFDTEPWRVDLAAKTFLMLYDTVPGGTGYLKQMMSDTDNVLGIFRLARGSARSLRLQRRPLEGRLLPLPICIPA